MDEIMGGRPLVNAAAHGVEVGFSEEDSLDASNISEDASDVESNFEEAATSSSAQTEKETGEEGTAHNCTLPSAAKKRRKPSSGYAKLMNVWSAEQKSFLDRIEQHQERNQQRDEMLLSRFLEESTRSTKRLLGQMFEGLRGLIPQPYEAAPHFQGHAPPHNSYMQPPQQYPGQFYNRPMLYTPNVPNSSGASTSDHNLHDLG
ncbi:uncharacterized protein [Misgurnus anguillicaudatus]|uniref:uncharacterized protein n=1 Tax=Misgurnus anguillicaudatus TaxID=75329 RepID=UPI003CCFAD94